MKTVIASVVLFALLLGFGTFAYYYIDNTAKHLAAEAATVEKSVQSKDWGSAERSYTKLQSSWNKASIKWTVLLDHQELDNINITMSRVKEFMDTRDIPGSRSELAELKMLLKHIPEKEAINVKNIL